MNLVESCGYGSEKFEIELRDQRINQGPSQLITQLRKLRKESSEKKSRLNGIRTHDLCDAGVVLYQLSYQANKELIII